MVASCSIWTVGHSTLEREQFIELLRSADICVVGDVRRYPGSRRYPHFNRDVMAQWLGEAGIRYVHLPELGGRRKASPDSPNTAWRNEQFRGYADHMASEEFRAGMERVLDMAASEHVGVMCAEAHWSRCHRSLISDWLRVRGHHVIHILSATRREDHPYTSAARVVDGRLSYGS